MNLSYFLVNHGTGPLLWVINIIVYLIIALILWLVIKWIATEFGVDPRIVNLVGLLLFLLLILSLFVGCTTTTATRPDGTVTRVKSQDPKVVKAVTEAVSEAAAKAAVQALEDAANRRNGLP